MPDYRLFYFQHWRIRGADVLTATDDDAAVLRAQLMVVGRHAELWRGAVKLRTFNEPEREPDST